MSEVKTMDETNGDDMSSQTKTKMTKEECNRHLAKCREAGRKIDPATAEYRGFWVNCFDPYGTEPFDIPDGADPELIEECRECQPTQQEFARAPGGDWIHSDDLPFATLEALRRRYRAPPDMSIGKIEDAVDKLLVTALTARDAGPPLIGKVDSTERLLTLKESELERLVESPIEAACVNAVVQLGQALFDIHGKKALRETKRRITNRDDPERYAARESILGPCWDALPLSLLERIDADMLDEAMAAPLD